MSDESRRDMSDEETLYQIVKDGFKDGCHYDKYRPDYTEEATSEIVHMLTANQEGGGDGKCDILELGAGTGKLTRHLIKKLPATKKFIASDPMKDFLSTLQTQCPGVATIQCSAESIPLPDDSVQGIVAAQCFHWFATEAGIKEMVRVLKPQGSIVLVSNASDRRVDWVDALVTKYLSYLADEEPQYMAFRWRDAIDNYPGLAMDTRKTLDYPTAQYTMEDVKNFYSTLAGIARMSSNDKRQALDDLEQLISTHPDTLGKTVFPYPRITDLLQYVKQ